MCATIFLQLGGRRFADLLKAVADVDPELRIRFTSPHPKDFSDDVLALVGERANICSSLHLPVQSGSTTMLERMGRGYSREAYLRLVERARLIIPDLTLSSDFISGFCGETEEEHRDTLSLIEEVGYDYAFCFPYSERKVRRLLHCRDSNPRPLRLSDASCPPGHEGTRRNNCFEVVFIPENARAPPLGR